MTRTLKNLLLWCVAPLYLDFSGGSSSSSSSSTTSTTNVSNDKRIALQSGVAVSGDAPVTINAADANAVNAGTGVANNAINAIQMSDATNQQSFTALLNLAGNLFQGAGNLVAATQNNALAQSQALTNAQTSNTGGVDQKTILMLALAGFGLAALRKRG